MYLNEDARCSQALNCDDTELELMMPKTREEFIEMIAVSYLKLAYNYVEEIEKPIIIMKKMIRKPLKSPKFTSKRSRADPLRQKIRRKSTSTQN